MKWDCPYFFYVQLNKVCKKNIKLRLLYLQIKLILHHNDITLLYYVF